MSLTCACQAGSIQLSCLFGEGSVEPFSGEGSVEPFSTFGGLLEICIFQVRVQIAVEIGFERWCTHLFAHTANVFSKSFSGLIS